MEQDPEEQDHYKSVLLSFREYESYMMREIYRRKKNMQKMPSEMQWRLPPSSTLRNLHHFVNATHQNQIVFNRVVQVQLETGPAVDLPNVTPKTPLQSPPRHFSKLKSTLHQFVRDWSDEGKKEREMCYTPVIKELRRVLTVDADDQTNRPRVLLPGAGLGRLALEIASRGYAVQGNEFSYQMLFASNFILNWVSQPQQFEIYPWIHNPSNALTVTDLLRPVTIPDVAPAELLGRSHGTTVALDFSMCAGEFLEAYADDKAPNVIEYIAAFERMLKPGGYWINLGPLLYHWQDSSGDDDERYGQSVELSYEEIKHVMTTYNFRIQKESQLECIYTNNVKSMMKTVFDCVFFTAVKETDQTSEKL
ncbi:hypothetical protein CCR75_008119 [Bremia lactucae]|uniref:carnosine N-methyltransferase n=1 Tax=Bremia lactucae TaxID=4779 RepID=A0A976IBT5_BRELC|nr:hypothetical protein CCR75_008119 [Bremia lactucae]